MADLSFSLFSFKMYSNNILKVRFFMIPQDPVMLLSFINLKLRDYYGSLEQLCEDLDVKEQEIRDKLASIDYHYNEERNQFV